MANNASARKRIRQTKARTENNRSVKGRLRSFRRRLLEKVEEGDLEEARKAYDVFASAADRAAKTNVIHKNTASRLKSRMAHRINGMAS